VDPKRFELVKYENHPMQDWADNHRRLVEKHGGDLAKAHEEGSAQRKLQSKTRSLQDSSWAPMRIYYETTALWDQDDGTNTVKLQFVEDTVLPKAAAFWSKTLSVVPVGGNVMINPDDLASSMYCGDSEFSLVPSSHMSTGVPDTDLVLYVSATPSTRFCGPSTLAVAVACNFDGYDRPVAGAVNICLDQITLNDDGSIDTSIIDDNVDVVIHEIGHVLAMSSNHFRFFRYPDGVPRTDRSFARTDVECVDGVTRSEYLPDTNTLDFFYDNTGTRYAAITTELVRATTRNQFNCQTLPGAKLENQPTGESCMGDHWDEKAFYSSTLSGIIAPDDNYFDPVTVALCEDSGWYLGNYSMTKVSPWGHAAGCEFVNDACLIPDSSGATTVPDYGRGFFCTQGSERGCSPGHTHKMACTVIDWDLYFPSVLPPAQFQYFSDQPGRGGPKQSDYCPVFGSTYRDLSASELDCRVEKNADFVNLYGEYHGKNSMCFETTTGAGRCYQAQCILSERKVMVNVRGEWRRCNYDFEELELISNTGVFEGKVICPRLTQACPEMFCPVNCAGRGECIFDNEVNGTVVPVCQCFDTSDTSPGCSASLILDGKYLENDSTLESATQVGFFDPLVSVFVDHPDTWDKATWGWASGIFVIFFMMILCICSSFWPTSQPKMKKRLQK